MQPLSGEYAVRREILETLPFPIGYGVETSHLIDVFQAHGLNAFAQTDLDRRVHRNQSTIDLGKMSFGILQSFLNRLRHYDIVSELPEVNGLADHSSMDHAGPAWVKRGPGVCDKQQGLILTYINFKI